MLQAGVIRPVKEATPWINSFGKDKSGNPKLHACLDPMNLNKAVICEPYHFKTPEDIAHLIANSCIMRVCDYKKGYWHQELDEASSFLTTFNTEFGRFQYMVMPFGITITGDVFHGKLDQCFSHLKNIIIIADDIMAVRKNSERVWSSSHNLTGHCKKMQCQIKLWQIAVQEDRVWLLWRDIHNQWVQASANQGICNKYNARTKLQERSPTIYRYDELPI